ncbi:uncharacterized protein LOC135139199 [Zophobas morio]|uniref:uncharacterized protein LOC135139199 n=1 Tax=Zophobas morio TaxID=2755281 RepID=UPI003083D5AB
MTQPAEIVAHFANQFHNIQGVTIAERKKNLRKLLNSASILKDNVPLLDTVVTQLHPQTYLEQRSFIEFLIYFRKYKELADEVFTKENPIAIKRILNQKWFFEQTLLDSGPGFLTQIVPTLSYKLTFKVLKKIAPLLEEQQANVIFSSLLEIYGISLATIVLTSCSCATIENSLKNYHLTLQQRQLKSLFDKNPHLIYLYFDERVKHEENQNFLDFNPIFHYIAKKDLNVFHDLCQKYNFKTKLGKRITKKLVALKRADILSHPELYVKNLHPRCLIKQLGPDFNAVYLKLFPKKIDDSPSSESSRLLKHYPRRAQYNLMITTYNQVFAKKLEERPHLIDEYLLEMIPDSQEREKFAKLKGGDDTGAYLKYYSPARCLQIVKERVNFARCPFERGNYVALLVESCFIDKNYDALLEVAKFVTERFKNDSADVQQKFPQMLLWQSCDYSQLSEEHWHEIKKIMARPDLTLYNSNTIEIFCKYIEFLTRLKKPIEQEIVDFYGKNDFAADYVAFIKDPRVQKRFLTTFIEIVPKVTTTNIESLDCKLLSACLKYNSQNPKETIQVLQYPRLLQSLRSVLSKKNKNEEAALPQALEVLLCSKGSTQDLEKLRQEFWNNVQFATPSLMKWYLKYKPESVQKNLNSFLSFAIKNGELAKDTKFWSSLKYYSHLSIDKGAIQFLTRDLTALKCRLLSCVLSEKDFLTVVETYKPAEFKVDGNNAQFNIQMALLNNMKNVNSTAASLVLLLKFCDGEYIPFCLGPLYSIIFKVPKNHLTPLFDEMKKTLTHHAYYFISLICNKEVVTQNLRDCQLDQAVKVSFKYFLNNSNQETWELFTTKLSTAESVGSFTIKLIATKQVPTDYKTQHFEKVWTILHKNDKYKGLLFKNVSKETLLQLPYDFLDRVIETELFSGLEINKPFSVYLIASSKLEENMNIVTNALEKYKLSAQFSIKRVHDFIATLFTTYMEQSLHNDTLIEALLSLLQRIFEMGSIFEPYVTLSLMKCKSEVPKDFAISVVVLHNSLIARYGETVTEIFGNVLKKLLQKFCQSDPLKYEFYYYLLIHQKSISDVLLAIKLLPSDAEPEDVDSCKYFDDIVHQLENLDVLSVQLHLNLYFKRLKIVQDVSYYTRVHTYAINMSSWLCPGAQRWVGYI